MKKIFTFLMLSIGTLTTKAQTTAVNFTAADCNSTSHTLFTELDNGKVIVMVWVMPCLSCISDAKGAYDAVQSFASSNPGQVLYYLADDNGGTSCATLNAWANSNAIGSNRTVFDNNGSAINEANYGGSGMPHVMVVGGGNSHTIFYNQLNGSNNGAAIQNAISQALTATSVIETAIEKIEFAAYPNPAKDKVSFSYALANNSEVSIDIINSTGAKVKTLNLGKQSVGKHDVSLIAGSTMSTGVYSAQLHTGAGTATVRFAVIE